MNTYPAEAIVVHGHGLTAAGTLDEQTAQRMDTALNAWKHGLASTLVLSGDHSFMLKNPPLYTEAAVMKSYALQSAIPDSAIKVEDNSLDTVGNVLFTKTLFALPNNWQNIIVVTSESHLPRTLKIYQHVFGSDFKITGIPAPEQPGFKEHIWEPIGATAMMREVLRGTEPGDHEAIHARLVDLVPGYGTGTVPRLVFKSLLGLLHKS